VSKEDYLKILTAKGVIAKKSPEAAS